MVLYATNKFEIQINRNLIKNKKQKRKKTNESKTQDTTKPSLQSATKGLKQDNCYRLRFKISLDLKLADVVETTYLGPCQTSMIDFFCECY